MMVALPAEVYCLLGELKAAVGSFLHFPHFPHFLHFLHFHVHTAAGSSLLNTPAMFPTFSGHCPYSGCSQHFHVFSHNSQHLMFPSPSYAGDSSYIFTFYIIYFSVSTCCIGCVVHSIDGPAANIAHLDQNSLGASKENLAPPHSVWWWYIYPPHRGE